ncbi:MAG TPA: alpha/beta fold hydrolase, partial [Phaeodactylibacter sp.]|nr:alpha/beta fold hydrolase [Phaeodactylibacter sp.]
MPLIRQSSYPGPPFYQFNGHLQSILPSVLRKLDIAFDRERIHLADGDFLDLDWQERGTPKLLILTHGLEGNSRRPYISGMVKLFGEQGWDSLAWNCRSCSGEMNKTQRLYHHGDIYDLEQVIAHALRTKAYEEIVLIGFSMGGSIVMKYLGVRNKELPIAIRTAVVFSAPCDLYKAAKKLDEPEGRFYKKRFLKKLKPKIAYKAQQYPSLIDFSRYEQIDSWEDFDRWYTIHLNGFATTEEFYRQGSAQYYIPNIRIPTLLVSALNDPIMPPEC